ncbi:uncharacterized protein LOC120080262 [Benincasa hispida]|uniref:uncharacterized protein LOC120080262 n=1 Tax=Benincasa hispida TaxID=102211 RepID=UPI0019014C5B|nr:uncharacterized protein LOC120080262 [Benincasa hispida]
MATQSTNPFVATPKSVTDLIWYIANGTSNHVASDHSSLTNSYDYGGKAKDITTSQVLMKRELDDGLYRIGPMKATGSASDLGKTSLKLDVQIIAYSVVAKNTSFNVLSKFILH